MLEYIRKKKLEKEEKSSRSERETYEIKKQVARKICFSAFFLTVQVHKMVIEKKFIWDEEKIVEKENLSAKSISRVCQTRHF